jgi:AraC-like DNA-binding protein
VRLSEVTSTEYFPPQDCRHVIPLSRCFSLSPKGNSSRPVFNQATGGNVRPCRIAKELEQVSDWSALALEAEYCAYRMANLLDVEERALRRFFVKRFGCPTHRQLEIFRQEAVEQMARKGVPEKVIASTLHFKHAPSFSRHFKKYHGTNFRLWLKNSAFQSPGLVPGVLSVFANFISL